MKKIIRVFLKLISFFIFTLLYKVEVKGLEKIPLEGRVILASNHASFLDPMVLFYVIPREFYALAGKWLFKIWPLGWILWMTNCLPTNGSSKKAISVLERGEMILIFPEGRCRLSKELIFEPNPHKGVAVLALKTGALVVPVALKGTFEAWPRTKIFPKIFKKITVNIGPPLKFEKYRDEIIPESLLKETLNRIISSIKLLLQP